jgi:hypothetical protein
MDDNDMMSALMPEDLDINNEEAVVSEVGQVTVLQELFSNEMFASTWYTQNALAWARRRRRLALAILFSPLAPENSMCAWPARGEEQRKSALLHQLLRNKMRMSFSHCKFQGWVGQLLVWARGSSSPDEGRRRR